MFFGGGRRIPPTRLPLPHRPIIHRMHVRANLNYILCTFLAKALVLASIRLLEDENPFYWLQFMEMETLPTVAVKAHLASSEGVGYCDLINDDSINTSFHSTRHFISRSEINVKKKKIII